jgi:hypothetical protein
MIVAVNSDVHNLIKAGNIILAAKMGKNQGKCGEIFC